MSKPMAPEDDARIKAGLDLLRRMGAHGVQLRFSDEEHPVVWMAVAEFRTTEEGRPAPEGEARYEAAGALTPRLALYRLLESLVDGGQCAHCGRPAAIEDDWNATLPMAQALCWQVFDPETKTYRRDCETETGGARGG